MVMRIEQVGRVAVAFHDECDPTEAEWNTWVDLCQKVRTEHHDRAACLIRTLGGAPNARQRAQLARGLGGSSVMAAVLTSSAIVRGVVTAIGWLGVPVRPFRPEAWDDIRDYLRLNPEERASLGRVLHRLSAGTPATSESTPG